MWPEQMVRARRPGPLPPCLHPPHPPPTSRLPEAAGSGAGARSRPFGCLCGAGRERAQRRSCHGGDRSSVLAGAGLESSHVVASAHYGHACSLRGCSRPQAAGFSVLRFTGLHGIQGEKGRKRGRAESFLRGNAAVVLRCSYFTAVVGVSQGSRR